MPRRTLAFLLQSGALDQPLASVDTNGSADGSVVVADQADAANALITVDADTSHTGDLGLGNVDLPVDVGGIGDVGGLLDTHAGSRTNEENDGKRPGLSGRFLSTDCELAERDGFRTRGSVSKFNT